MLCCSHLLPNNALGMLKPFVSGPVRQCLSKLLSLLGDNGAFDRHDVSRHVWLYLRSVFEETALHPLGPTSLPTFTDQILCMLSLSDKSFLPPHRMSQLCSALSYTAKSVQALKIHELGLPNKMYIPSCKYCLFGIRRSCIMQNDYSLDAYR